MNTTTDHARIVVNPLLVYVAMLVAAALLQSVMPLPFLAQTTARLLGLAIMIISLLIGSSAARGMLAAKTALNPLKSTTTLLLSGPFRFTRNPMYFALTLQFAGLVTFLQLPWGLVLLPLVVWLINKWVILPEEQYLEAKFGNEYLEYKSRVRRWV